MSNENLEKIHVDLPNHWGTGGESFWAENLGDNKYRLRNVPFYAYGLNFHDIVRATPDSEDLIPEIRNIVEPSGHKTLRIFFESEFQKENQAGLLDQLQQYEAYYERATDSFVAIDVEVQGNYNAVFDQLTTWEEDGILSFESCEARVDDSFDDIPES